MFSLPGHGRGGGPARAARWSGRGSRCPACVGQCVLCARHRAAHWPCRRFPTKLLASNPSVRSRARPAAPILRPHTRRGAQREGSARGPGQSVCQTLCYLSQSSRRWSRAVATRERARRSPRPPRHSPSKEREENATIQTCNGPNFVFSSAAKRNVAGRRGEGKRAERLQSGRRRIDEPVDGGRTVP